MPDGMTRECAGEAVALHGMWEHAGALARIDAGVAEHPGDAGLQTLKADLRLALGRHDRPLEALSRAIEPDPGVTGAHSARAAGLASTGKHDTATPSFCRAIELDPSSARLFAPISAPSSTVVAATAEAREPFGLANELDPACPRLPVEGSIQSAPVAHAESLADLDRANELDPRDATAHSERDGVLAGLGRHEEAAAQAPVEAMQAPTFGVLGVGLPAWEQGSVSLSRPGYGITCDM